jgi:hypothetical protein
LEEETNYKEERQVFQVDRHCKLNGRHAVLYEKHRLRGGA